MSFNYTYVKLVLERFCKHSYMLMHLFHPVYAYESYFKTKSADTLNIIIVTVNVSLIVSYMQPSHYVCSNFDLYLL